MKYETLKLSWCKHAKLCFENIGILLPQVIHACGGAVDSTISSHCTHLLCESQVSNMYVQVSMRLKATIVRPQPM